MIVGVYPLQGSHSLGEDPWNHFVAGIQTSGAKVIDLRASHLAPDALIVFNRLTGRNSIKKLERVDQRKRILVIMEPPASQPKLHTASYVNKFAHIFTASRDWVTFARPHAFNWPQTIEPTTIHVTQTADVTLVAGNKRSAMGTSLYGLRRSVLRLLEEQSVNAALYGPMWHSTALRNSLTGTKGVIKAISTAKAPVMREAYGDIFFKPNSWRGYVANKSAAIRSAPVSIVIENSPDYISEKLIDVVRAGRIPIYVGPQLERYGLPGNLAIAAAANSGSIVGAATQALRNGAPETVSCGQDWLQSQSAKDHSAPVVLFDLGHQISSLL